MIQNYLGALDVADPLGSLKLQISDYGSMVIVW